MERRNCFLCGQNGAIDPLDKHHIFGGANRKKSEKYGLCVYLCHFKCHIFGENSAHKNKDTMLMLHRYGQSKVMKENGWDKQRFISEFGKNYL